MGSKVKITNFWPFLTKKPQFYIDFFQFFWNYYIKSIPLEYLVHPEQKSQSAYFSTALSSQPFLYYPLWVCVIHWGCVSFKLELMKQFYHHFHTQWPRVSQDWLLSVKKHFGCRPVLYVDNRASVFWRALWKI